MQLLRFSDALFAVRAAVFLCFCAWGNGLQAETFEKLLTFDSGQEPVGGLELGKNGKFYGVTSSGGARNLGSVFTVSESGTHTLLHSFNGTGGSVPTAGLVLHSNGSFYGVTSQGGEFGKGTVYRISAGGIHKMLYAFEGKKDGAQPGGRLVEGTDGVLYGTTVAGGVNKKGTIFKITVGGNLAALHQFKGNNGSKPEAGLLLGPDGAFYGTASEGGASGLGVVFRITDQGAFSLLTSFSGQSGANPLSGLVFGADGGLFGCTSKGGVNDKGTAFRITTAGVFSLLHSFTGAAGEEPVGDLVRGAGTLMFGATAKGGTQGKGTIFKITTAGVHEVLLNFTGANGEMPRGGLAATIDNLFYGCTAIGGTNGKGTLFKMSTSGVLTTLHSFPAVEARYPGGLLTGSSGAFLGASSEGGAFGKGSIFTLTSTGSFAEVYAFETAARKPLPDLVLGNDGAYYGTTEFGGVHNEGTVFKVVTSGSAGDGVLTVLHSFKAAQGRQPGGGLVKGSDGAFYGTTQFGGAFECGTIFKIMPDGTHSVLRSLHGNDGRRPLGKLVQGTDGALYGATDRGGVKNQGTIFKIAAGNNFKMLHSFGKKKGRRPVGGLVVGNDGALYGTTRRGGVPGFGEIFRISDKGELKVLFSFNRYRGATPLAGLVLGADGSFYGTTSAGGKYGLGTVFRADDNGFVEVLESFDGTGGEAPQGTLAFGLDGHLYGTTINTFWRVLLVPGGVGFDVLHKRGDAVPGAPGATEFLTFGTPSINDAGDVAFFGKVTEPGGSGSVNAVFGGVGNAMVAKAGDAAPGTSETFGTFYDPLLNEDGAVAFLGKLKGDEVTAANDYGLFSTMSGGLDLHVREGDEMETPAGAILKSIKSVAMSGTVLAFVGDLVTVSGTTGPGGVMASNDRGLWMTTGGPLVLVLREGSTISLSTGALKVTEIMALVEGSNNPGQGLGVVGNQIKIGVKGENGRQAVLSASGAVLTEVASKNKLVPPGTSRFATFGVPSQALDGKAVFRGSLLVGGSITQSTDAGIFGEFGGVVTRVVMEGAAAPGTSGTFSIFNDPVRNGLNEVAFVSTLRGTAPTVTGSSDTAVYLASGTTGVALVAREGSEAPETRGALFSRFKSLALPDSGPVFLASLVRGKAGVTAENDTGVWGLDSSDNLRLLLRKGQVTNGRKVKAFQVLNSVPFSSNQTRVFNQNNELIARVTFADDVQAIVVITIP